MKTIYTNRQIQQCRIMARIQSNLLKFVLLVISITALSIANARNHYVATTGSDANPGTLSLPYKTWAKLSTVMLPGDIAYIRGGTYTSTAGAGGSIHCYLRNINGTASNWIIIQNYPGEYPVLDLTNIGVPTNENPRGVLVENCSYLRLKGLRITGLQQHRGGNGISWGWNTFSSTFIIHERIEIDHIGGRGFSIGNSNDVTYLNCDVHHIDDRWSNPGAWGGADGFSGTGGEGSTRTTYEGCRSWWCSDDGFDFFSTDGLRTLKNCWSFWNGYQPGTFITGGNGEGFKLGPTNTNQSATITKILTNCMAFENRANGFSQNTGQSRYRLYNNISYNNGERGFWWGWHTTITQDFKNNIAYNNPNGNMDDGGQAQGSYNSWNGAFTVSNTDFLSVSSMGVDGPRQTDGSLPNLSFLKLAQGSEMIDAGINVGLPFNGMAPDKGYNEFGNFTLPIHDVALTGKIENNKHVLNWRIIADEPIKTIVIETSTDATNFSVLTGVTPSTDKYTYQPFNNGTVFYRLRVTSVLDQTVLSNVIALKSTGVDKATFNVSTLVQTEITINASSNYQYTLTDVNGRIIATGNGIKGFNRIDINKQPKGMYFIKLTGNDVNTDMINSKETQKIVKH